ncbi:hypothetical protein ACF08M_34390 [Streptomyces sp. NPDC015032]|uniref:hypothetical protein n=1 Tax=Streptomyces sp. NPDC015032 TaxID=3364937 RepID=UPI0036FE5597
MTPPVLSADEITRVTTPELVFATVRDALIAHATSPVLHADHVRRGAQVTGIGGDMPHKNELPPALFARAALIATDDHQQCLEHGDFGHAVRAGSTTDSGDTPVGRLLERPVERPDGAITVADLTGVGALDAALASAVLRELTR